VRTWASALRRRRRSPCSSGEPDPLGSVCGRSQQPDRCPARQTGRVPPAQLHPASGRLDSLAVGKLLALDLANGWAAEAFRATVATACPGPSALLYQAPSGDRILYGNDHGAPTDRGSDDVARGSNNWVLAAAHTDRHPLLANDPHLQLGVPSIWTAVHLTPGTSLPGSRFPHGVTWAATAAWLGRHQRARRQRIWRQAFDSQDRNRYRLPDGGWAQVDARRDHPHSDRAVLFHLPNPASAVRSTRHGPLVNIRGDTYSVDRTREDDRAPAFLAMNRAKDWGSFRKRYGSSRPVQNCLCRRGPHRLVLGGGSPAAAATSAYPGDSTDGD
jgi:acyl-homoserine lactone acylase PvdQ